MFDCLSGLNGKSFKGNGCILADGLSEFILSSYSKSPCLPLYLSNIYFLDMGLGKSLQAITLMWTLLKQGPNGKPFADTALIICPSSLVQNWDCELKKWLGESISIVAISDSKKTAIKKLNRFESGHDVLIISYDQLKIHYKDICKMKSIGLVIADEGHRLKNVNIKTTQAASQIPTKKRVILSGTPIQNDLKEFYSLVSFVNPQLFGSETKFKNVFEEPVLRSREPSASDVEKKEGLARMKNLIQIVSQFILRRTFKTNLKYLPSKTEYTLFFRLTEFQTALYEELLSSYSEQVIKQNALGCARGKSPALSLLSLLKKLCNSPDLLIELLDRRPDSLPTTVLDQLRKTKYDKAIRCHATFSGKMTFTKILLQKVLSRSNDRVVIVSMYKQTLELLAALCLQHGISYLQLDGSTSINKRQELVDQLNDPKRGDRVMLLSSKAGGVGLNLIGANHLILFDGSWNPADDAQVFLFI